MLEAASKGRSAQDWQARLQHIVTMMREMSRQTDPQAMVRTYTTRIRQIVPTDGSISLSRRDQQHPRVVVTRYSGWKQPVNPWKEKEHLPVLSGGLLADLIYGDEPVVLDEIRLGADDPGAEYLKEFRSLMAIPLFDRGAALNMVVLLGREKGAFDRRDLPERVWMSNLFGRATQNLVLSGQLADAYARAEHDMRVVAEIQRSLLPEELPRIPTMDLAAHYQTSQQAGGDYYDFFDVGDGRWGILIADVSGHGTPAAVIMAIMHSFAHSLCEPQAEPAGMLRYLNDRLLNRYTARSGSFVTAFYGVYDARTREIRYANAGHPPPRLKRCDDGSMASLDEVGGVPLCVIENASFSEASLRLVVGDQLIFYTDGVTEAQNPTGEMFGANRLDEVLGACRPGARAVIDSVLRAVDGFTAGRPPDDDRTVLVAKIH